MNSQAVLSGLHTSPCRAREGYSHRSALPLQGLIHPEIQIQTLSYLHARRRRGRGCRGKKGRKKEKWIASTRKCKEQRAHQPKYSWGADGSNSCLSLTRRGTHTNSRCQGGWLWERAPALPMHPGVALARPIAIVVRYDCGMGHAYLKNCKLGYRRWLWCVCACVCVITTLHLHLHQYISLPELKSVFRYTKRRWAYQSRGRRGWQRPCCMQPWQA